MKIGIIAAVPEEINTIHNDIHFFNVVKYAEREFHLGKFEEVDLVLTISHVGKVAASITAAALIDKLGVDKIIFTGLAGAVSQKLKRGDIVLCDQTYQHDLDARPLCKEQFQEPLSGRQLFKLDTKELSMAKSAIDNFFQKLGQYVDLQELKRLDINEPKCHVGIIATGDQFIQDVRSQPNLYVKDMEALAVEMEGAAVAQVCAEHSIPYILIRTISDKANEDAHVSLQDFSVHVASRYASGMVQEILKLSA